MKYFIHIPKTAGTSFVQGVERALPDGKVLKLYGKHLSSEDIRRNIERMPDLERENIDFVAGHQVWYGIHEFFGDKHPEYITFLRSPVSRVVSDFYKILRKPSNEFHKKVTSQNVSLEQFVRRRMSPYIVNHMTVFLGRDWVDRNHNAKLCVKIDKALLKRSMERLASFAYVGLKSTYASDLRRLSDLMGIDIPLVHANRPALDPHTLLSGLSTPLLLKIQKLNMMDAVLYDYANILHERIFANKPDASDGK